MLYNIKYGIFDTFPYQFLKEVQRLELLIISRSFTYHPFKISLFPRAWAQNLEACVNNAIIENVSQCESSNNWSFNIEQTQDFRKLIEAGFQVLCPSGEQPCGLVAGLSHEGSLVCSPNSTRLCFERGNLQALVNLRAQCQGQ